MNKKVQYQINTIKDKIVIYNDTIQTLIEKRNSIIANDNNDTNNTNNTNNTNDTNKIKELQNLKTSLELEQQILKKNISNISNEIKQYENYLESLNLMHLNNINNEDNIYKEELSRIEEQKANIIEENKKNLELAYIDKQNLYNNIELIKNELNIQNNKISQIQIISHSNRKNILDDLHQKKKDKLIIQQSINTYKDNEIFSFNQITTLENSNDQIIDFKTNIINSNYNIETDDTKLLNYYNEYNIDINLSINEKITILDKIFNDNENKIKLIKLKYKKQKNRNDMTIKDIIDIDNYNKNNRIKILGYKDQFKIEKEIRNNLENILNNMTNDFNTFDDIIIGNINNDFLNMNNELENDILRSYSRLNIMKNRIIDNFNNETENKKQLIENNKNKLLDLHNQFNNIIVELENVKTNTKNTNIIINEITNIDNEIEKYQSIILQMNNDIEKLKN
jgi:hypothetical protein